MDVERLRYYSRWHDVVNQRRYDAPADPWKLLRVDPTTVTAYNNEARLNWGVGRVEGGGWDQDQYCHPLCETVHYRGLTQRFEEGRDWEETALYEWAAEQFENDDGPVRGYDSLEAFRNVRCEYVDDLFRAIEREGYRPNAEASHEHPATDNAFEEAYVHHLEPLVVVGRDGDIYLSEGFHRFTIAAILELDEIPVHVLCRHEQWQQVRDRVAEAEVGEHADYADHPDLRDVRS